MNNPVFLSGKGINLCPLDPDGDLSDYLSWINGQNITTYMGSGYLPATKQSLREYIQNFKEKREILLGIFPKKNNIHIGNITLQYIDHQNRLAEIGIIIGNTKFQRQGFGCEAVMLVLHHAFMRLNLHKVYAGAIKGNAASKKLFEKSGFCLEATLRKHFYLDGKYLDWYRFGYLREDYSKEEKNDPLPQYPNKS